jgi:hypothetical protein
MQHRYDFVVLRDTAYSLNETFHIHPWTFSSGVEFLKIKSGQVHPACKQPVMRVIVVIEARLYPFLIAALHFR